MKKSSNNYFNIVAIADIHFGKKNDKKLYSDLKEQFLDYLPSLYSEYGKINMIVICGDLFDRVIKMSESSSNYVLKFIEEICEITNDNGIYLRLIKGTKGHDYSQLNNFIYMEKKYPLFKIIFEASSERIDDKYDILYLPEEYPEDYNKYYSKLFSKKYDFIFGHGMIDFVAFTGDNSVKLTRKEAVHSVEKLDSICKYFTVFGHIHDMKNYQDRDKILYCGSFERFSFADQEDKGYLLLRLNEDTEDTEVYLLENENASVYNIIDLNDYEFDNVEDQLKFIEEQKENCDYLKVIMTKNEDETLLKNLISNDIKVESKINIKEDVVDERYLFLLKREFPIDVSISKYIEITNGKKISKEKINKFISINN